MVPNYLNNIKVNDMVIKRSPQVKYLGIILDDKLQWKQYIVKLKRDLVKIVNHFKIIKSLFT